MNEKGINSKQNPIKYLQRAQSVSERANACIHTFTLKGKKTGTGNIRVVCVIGGPPAIVPHEICR